MSQSNASSWVTETYIENLLRKLYSDDAVELIAIRLDENTDGRGFCALITKLFASFLLNGSKSEKHFIVKIALPASDAMKRLCEEDNIFQTEIDFYGKIAPLMLELWRKFNISQKVFPQLLGINNLFQSLILEDIIITNEYTSEYQGRLNEKDSKLFLNKIALFHATSAALEENTSNVSKTFRRGMFHTGKMFAEIAFKEMFQSLVRVSRTWKFDLSNIDYLQKTIEVCRPNPTHFNSLIHGDCHKNNFFLKTDTSDVVLIDFQAVKWSSPALDLHLFLQSSADINLIYEKENEMVHYYYGKLEGYLKCFLFEGRIPTFQQFWQEYEEKRFYGKNDDDRNLKFLSKFYVFYLKL